jgi:hypothetical protein
LAQRLTLQEYVFSDNRFLRGSISNSQVLTLCNFTIPLTNHIGHPAARIPRELGRQVLQSAKENLFGRFDFFGLSEQFAESMALLDSSFALGITVRSQQTVLNVSADDVPDLSPDVVARISDLNSLDIPLYEAAREEFARRLAGAAGAG